ncbi:MAG: hypothetical protein A2X66_06170 [Ignavibacteria bacterium GWA2_54_16]|nr:MAG: hypothetical protein A2X66_06170 [Ignavibacteria bacterium GWA2_54_16]
MGELSNKIVRGDFSVLNVDSDPESLSSTTTALRNRGYVVLESASGAECLRVAKKEKPDVLLIGPGLRDIDSARLCAQLKAEGTLRDTPVVLISPSVPDSDSVGEIPLTEADAYLIQPFSSEQLHACIFSMLRRKQAVASLAQGRAPNRGSDRGEVTESARTSGEEFFRAVTENASDMILILSKRGLISYASPSVERFLGYTPGEMMGKSAFRFIHTADLTRAFNDFTNAVQMKELTIPNSFRVLHKDGSERILEGLGKNLLESPTIAGFIMNVHDVTERKRMEEASRIFAHTLESISEIVTITDFEDRFTYVNQAFINTYGYQRDEVLRQHVGILWSPNNPAGLLKEILEQNRTSSWSGELLNLTKDGREFPIALHTSRIRNEKGEVIGLVGISQDITDRRKAEARLRESEAKFRDLVEQIDEVIFTTDPEGRITYISPTAEALSGYKPEEIVGHPITEFVDPPFHPKIQARLRNLAAGKLEPIEYRVRIKSGEFRWVRSSGTAILEAGKPIGMRAVLADITAQKRAQETVSLLSHAIKSIAECVSITDHKNNILFVNQAFLTTYGYTHEEMIGQHITIVNPRAGAVGEVLDSTLRGGWQGELVNRKKDGTEFPIFLSTSFVLDENADAIALVGVATDISERKRIERKLELQRQNLQESYEQLRQLELARDTLMHMIIHDMRSRLFVLMVGLEFLEKNELDHIAEENRRVLHQARSMTTALTHMVNSLLDISKMESGEMKLSLADGDLTKIARKVVSEFELRREERRFLIDAPSRPVDISCDVDVVSRVIQNLFENALNYTPADGTIVVRVQKTDGGARVAVEDTGIGIESSHLSKIFNKFYQVEARGESTGLGLTFCKLAVELHRGRIGVESEMGKGSTFWFTLPAQTA